LQLDPEDRFHCCQVQARSRGKLLGYKIVNFRLKLYLHKICF
jgi:hypothetical protein